VKTPAEDASRSPTESRHFEYSVLLLQEELFLEPEGLEKECVCTWSSSAFGREAFETFPHTPKEIHPQGLELVLAKSLRQECIIKP
jgi:hypothetical protein